MRKLILFFLIIIAFFQSQAQTRVLFNYDQGGNQVLRYICINCNGRVATDTIQSTPEIISQDIKDDLNSKISYYPNPVREELNIKWMNENQVSVSSIEVFSMTGQSLGSYTDLDNVQSTTVGFGTYPQGFYNLTLYFSDGSKETLKVVKK